MRNAKITASNFDKDEQLHNVIGRKTQREEMPPCLPLRSFFNRFLNRTVVPGLQREGIPSMLDSPTGSQSGSLGAEETHDRVVSVGLDSREVTRDTLNPIIMKQNKLQHLIEYARMNQMKKYSRKKMYRDQFGRKIIYPNSILFIHHEEYTDCFILSVTQKRKSPTSDYCRKSLGKGAFGRVKEIQRYRYKVQDRTLKEIPTMDEVVKVIEFDGNRENQEHQDHQFQAVQNEVRLLKRIYGDNQIHFLEVRDEFDEVEKCYIMMPHLKGINLNTYMRQGISREELLCIYKQLLYQVQHIHQQGILHLDLKPHNMLYDPDTSTLSIIDYGFATDQLDIHGVSTKKNIGGTAFFMAPEALTGEGVTVSADVFSMGMTVFCLLASYYSHNSYGDIHTHQMKHDQLLNAYFDGEDKQFFDYRMEYNEFVREWLEHEFSTQVEGDIQLRYMAIYVSWMLDPNRHDRVPLIEVIEGSEAYNIIPSQEADEEGEGDSEGEVSPHL